MLRIQWLRGRLELVPKTLRKVRCATMKKMDVVQFLLLVENSVEATPGSISLEHGLDEIGWDSIAHLSLIAEVDRVGGLAIDSGSSGNARTVSELYLSVFLK
jgi:acyl carrier protein